MASTEDYSHLDSSESPSRTSPLDVWQCMIFVFAVYGVLVGSVMLFGLSGNLLTIVIMLRDKGKTTMNRLLAFLAIVDGMSLLISGTFYTARGLVEYFPSSKQVFLKLLGITFPPSYVLTRVLNQISSYLTMIIACHRYLSICHPHKMKILCSPRRMQIYMAATVVVSILCYVPSSAVMYETKKLPNGVYLLRVTDFQQSDAFMVMVILRFILNFVIPLPCLTLMAYKIVRTLRDNRFRKLTDKERATRSLTMSILMVIVIFIIFKLPEALLALYSLMFPIQEHTDCPKVFFYLNSLPTVCIVCNAASNVIVYTIFMHGFRRQLMTLLLCRRPSSVAPSTVVSTKRSQRRQLQAGAGPWIQSVF